MAYNKIQALRDNIAAIEIILNVQNNSQWRANLSDDDREALRKYSGFGGIKEVMYWQDYKTMADVEANIHGFDRQIARLLVRLYDRVMQATDDDDNRTYDIMNQLSESVLNAFYTPNEVINAVGHAIKHVKGVFNLPIETMLEPSAGIGGFLPAAPEGCKTVAFEIDYVTSEILRMLHPETEVYGTGFEKIDHHRALNYGVDDKVLKTGKLFDMTASNIPFSQYGIHDTAFEHGDAVHRRSLEKIHRYFFVKALDQLEDGGILAFVTSRGIADTAECDYLRKWLVEQGNLLAAVRLPDNLFMQGSGVEVGSDLIVVQRDSHKAWQTISETQFIESKDKMLCVDGKQEMVQGVNTLLSQRRHAIYTHRRLDTNQYGRMVCKYYWRDGMDRFEHELASQLQHDMERCFALSAWQYGHDEQRKEREQQQSDRMRKGREEFQKRLRDMRPDYDALMESFNNLSSNEQRDKREYPFERQELNQRYDAFVEKWGVLHHKKNENVLKNYPEYQRALALERRDGKEWVKADIFVKPIHFHVAGDEKMTPMEALAMSMNEYGKVNMPYMSELTGKSQQDLYDALRGEIFYYPTNGNDGFLEWQHKSQCINGNVIQKKKDVEEYTKLGGLGEFETKVLLDTINALNDAIPTPIDYDAIDIKMGARWLPTEYYARFMKWLFKCRDVEINFFPEADKYSFKLPVWYDESDGWMSGPYAVSEKGVSGFMAFDYALHDEIPEYTCNKMRQVLNPDGSPMLDWQGKPIMEVVRDQSGKPIKVKDEKTLQMVQEKVQLIRDKFDEYMHSSEVSDVERAAVAMLYNVRFNANIRAVYDGSLQTFPGLDLKALGIQDLYQSQKDAIFMVKTLGGGILWYEVGLGKTLIMVIASMEMKRLGLCHKPMIICMKATVGQIADTYRKAYPNARVLAPGEKDFTSKNRREFIEQIANNDWDCIVMTYEQFYKIPQDKDTMRSVFTTELRDLEECLRIARDKGTMTKQVMQGLKQRQKSLQNKLNKLDEKLDKECDDVMTFKECGIDMLFVDEYHNFKNLGYNSHYNVAGMGAKDGNIKTMILLSAIRTIQEHTGRDLGACFLSGTVVANALPELFVAFKYLRPKELKRLGMSCFDAWASNFCLKSVDYDLNTMGQIQSKERFRSYLNIPELSMMLREITDFRTADMINIDRPKANIIEDFADPSEEQQSLLERLLDYASCGNWGIMGLEEKEYQDNSKRGSTALIATNLARDISMDVRLMGATQFHDDPQNKVNRCARRVAEYYRCYNEQRGVQFIFCDCSTFDGAEKKRKERIKEDGIDEHVWNIYEDLRDKLVENYGIPSREIAFIHDYDTDIKKAKLFDDLNNGRVRVIFGTTIKLGTGVNAQRRAVAVHHLDIPWRPADLEQRNGRAVRAGNEVKIWGGNKVDVIVYGTNKTLDAYKFKLLQNKAFFIKQINNGSITERHFDEDSMTEEGGMPYAEMVAALSGNQDFLVKAKLDAQVARLKTSQANHRAAVRKAESKIRDNERQIANIKRVIPLQQQDLADVEQYKQQHGIDLHVQRSKDETPDEIARALRQWRTECHENGVVIGNVYGCDIRMTTVVNHITNQMEYNQFEVMGHHGNIAYRCDQYCYGRIGESLEQNFQAFDTLPDAIRKRIADNETGIRTREADTKVCQTTIDTPWPHEAELAAKQQELNEVSARVQAVLDAEEAKRQAKVAVATAAAEQ